MKDVALFYGTYTGVTGTVAQKIVNELGADKDGKLQEANHRYFYLEHRRTSRRLGCLHA